ncbi:MAG: cytochrome b [Pseudomonadota bacterium]
MAAAEAKSYTAVAIALHWAIAISILALLPVGVIMGELENGNPWKFQLYQLHKSFGIVVLLLSVARLAWRFTHPVPPLPDGMKAWERAAARGAHVGFYGLIFLIPFTGWAMVSASPWNIPTKLFGVVPWPHIPIIKDLEDKRGAEEIFYILHGYLAFAAIVLIVLHVGAALKHHIINKDDVLIRMLPVLRRK